MNWCLFCFFMVFRCSNFLLTHLVWVYTLYIQCLYFMLWKSYDVLWIWMHLILCICLPPLRSDNIFLMACGLVRRKISYPSKTCRELFKEQWAKEESGEQHAVEEGENPESRPEKSDRLATAISLALFLLRMRVSFAMLMGNLNHKLFMPIHKRQETMAYKLFGAWSDLFIAFLWVDVGLLWMMAFWAFCRQCRLCCVLGCCRFYLWVVGLITIGAICMEIPMTWYVGTRLDSTWCEWTWTETYMKSDWNNNLNSTPSSGAGGGW